MSKKGFVKEFTDFIAKGNVMELAVGVIIGTAFKGIVDSLVSDIIMPFVSYFVGGMDFANWFIPLDGNKYDSLSAAQEAGAATLNYGNFISLIINFLLMALVVFCIVKGITKLTTKKEAVEAVPTTKVCPFCKTEISVEAVKCPNCTSDL